MTGWILVATGAATAVAGLAACLFPRFVLRLGFAVEADAALCFFVRHWGLLIGIVGALLVAAAPAPALRGPVLIAAAIEKFAIGGLVFFGPLKRTPVMTAAAIADGAFAIVYLAYLAGL